MVHVILAGSSGAYHNPQRRRKLQARLLQAAWLRLALLLLTSVAACVATARVAVAAPQSTSAYIYDALGRRIATVVDGQTTHFLYGSGINVLEERAADTSLEARYTHGATIDEPLMMERAGNSYTYHRDAQGSIVALSDSAGTLVERVAYDVYGEPSFYGAAGAPLPATSVGNPYFFTGRRYDAETGNNHYRARSYNPALGRFLQTDPVGYVAGSMNLYQYANDSPLRFTDPLGLDGDADDGVLDTTINAAKTTAKKTFQKLTTTGGMKDVVRTVAEKGPRNLVRTRISLSSGGKFAGKGVGQITGIGLTLLSDEGVEAGRGITQIHKQRQLERELVGDIRPYNPFRDPDLKIPDPDLRRPPKPAPRPPEPPCEEPVSPPFASLSRAEQIAYLQRELQAAESESRRLFRENADEEAQQEALRRQDEISARLERLLVDELRNAEVELYRARKRGAPPEAVNDAKRRRDATYEQLQQVERIRRFFEP